MTGYTEVVSAAALGLLTSVYPCTMATNLTALSWLASSGHSVSRTAMSGLAYALGRAFTYTALGLLLSWAALSHVRVAEVLQHYAELLLGPFLVLTGMFVSRLITIGGGIFLAQRFDSIRSHLRGVLGAFIMGTILALAFCPASAALFFGSIVMGLASGMASPVLLPAAYGIGTALPVLVIAFVFARGMAALQTKLKSARWFKQQLPVFTGGALIVIGIYLAITNIIIAP